MASLRLEVPEELLERLDAETDLLGFDAREEYVEWILRHRATMKGDAEQNRILAAYAQRLEDLEERLAAADVDASGEPDRPDPPDVEANLAPATDRIADDPVGELADELAGVEGQRLDEMARQAVARTREELGEGPGTGLDYRSRTSIDDDGPRPGSDIADLDDLAVPGYDDELVARRREAVGAALAYLKDVGEARRGEFVDVLYGECPAGYDSVDGWWECLKRGLRQVDRVDDAGEGSRTWRFRDVKGRVRVLRD